jgi:hypothetical protein
MAMLVDTAARPGAVRGDPQAWLDNLVPVVRGQSLTDAGLHRRNPFPADSRPAA